MLKILMLCKQDKYSDTLGLAANLSWQMLVAVIWCLMYISCGYDDHGTDAGVLTQPLKATLTIHAYVECAIAKVTSMQVMKSCGSS